MKNTGSGLLKAFLLSCSLFSLANVKAAQVPGQEAVAASVVDKEMKSAFEVDTPLFVFKTTAKDPYAMEYRSGSSILSMITFGYCPKGGYRVERVTNPSEQLTSLIPIRSTILFEDGPVKIDVKYLGWRESVIARGYENVLEALSLINEKPYKGFPFADQYLENIPMKWVFNNSKELSALCTYLASLFDHLQVAVNNDKKPVLMIDIEGKKNTIAQEDLLFLNRYFTLADKSNPDVKEFFESKQRLILEAVLKMKDAKQVKMSATDMILNVIEGEYKEFKMKDLIWPFIGATIAAYARNNINKLKAEWCGAAQKADKKSDKKDVAQSKEPAQEGTNKLSCIQSVMHDQSYIDSCKIFAGIMATSLFVASLDI